MNTIFHKFVSNMTITDFQLEYTLTSNSGDHINFTLNLGGKCLQSNYIDLKFYNLDGTELPHYILHNETTTRCFVKTNVITGTNIIVIRYGSLTEPDTQDSTNTFVFFDDFTDDTMTLWRQSGTITVSDGICNVNGSIQTISTIPEDNAVEINFKSTKVTTAKLVLKMQNGTNYIMLDLIANLCKCVINNVLTTSVILVNANTWATVKYIAGSLYVNNQFVLYHSTILSGSIAVYATNTDLHWVIARKWTSATFSPITFTTDITTLGTFRTCGECMPMSESSVDAIEVKVLIEDMVNNTITAPCKVLTENLAAYQPDPNETHYLDFRGRFSYESIVGFTRRMKIIIATLIPNIFVSFYKIENIKLLYERRIIRDKLGKQ